MDLSKPPSAQFKKDVITETGYKELHDQDRLIAKREEEIKTMINEPVGVDRAEIALNEDEAFLESVVKPKLEELKLKLDLVKLQGQASNIEFKIKTEESKKHLQDESEDEIISIPPVTGSEQERKEDADFQEAYKNLVRSTNSIIPLSKSVEPIFEFALEEYVDSVNNLLDQLRNPLEPYKRKKTVLLAMPKWIYLVFTFVILTIGASMAGEKLEENYLKIGFAILVWAVQEFLVTPLYERYSLRFRQQQLSSFSEKLSNNRTWALFLIPKIEHQLNQRSQRTG